MNCKILDYIPTAPPLLWVPRYAPDQAKQVRPKFPVEIRDNDSTQIPKISLNALFFFFHILDTPEILNIRRIIAIFTQRIMPNEQQNLSTLYRFNDKKMCTQSFLIDFSIYINSPESFWLNSYYSF